MYELGPEPPPDDIDGRSPSVVTWHDVDMFYLIASGEMRSHDLVSIANSLYAPLSPHDLVSAIAAGDRASLTRAPGVGARLAVRVLTELRDKVGAMPSTPGLAVPRRGPPGVAEDAISALVNLGYRRPEAQPAVAGAVERLGDTATLDVVIRDSLKELAQRAPG